MRAQSINLLLVDDEPRNLDALAAILDDPDYVLLRADNPDDALRLLLEHEVAAIVLDIQMPGMSGLELAQLIKKTKRFRQIPILFLTAYMLDDQHQLAGYGVGAVDYLTKPINPQILRHKISVFADLLRKTRALAELNDSLEQRVRDRTAELERSEAALRAADRQKDEFLAILAHELRNPLAPLRTGLDLLSSGTAPSSVVNRTLGAMNRQLDHMVRLIDDLLDISRIRADKLELDLERVDLASVIGHAVDDARTHFERRRQSISVSGDSAPAVLDRVRVGQIIGNLLHNASKYTGDGGAVRIEWAMEDGLVRVRVSDNGVGIPPDQLERIFQMFVRVARSMPSADPGLGIGLALARRLAEKHGGSLSAISAGEGRGSTFTLVLPTLHEGRGSVPASMLAAPPQQGCLEVVVIEDNPDISSTVGDWLQQHGHRVRIADTGVDGVALVRDQRPDLVLCDIGLPDISGVEVGQAIRALPLAPQPTLVAVTGWGRDDDRRRTSDAGFDAHLVKPFNLKQLRSILNACLAKRGVATATTDASAREGQESPR